MFSVASLPQSHQKAPEPSLIQTSSPRRLHCRQAHKLAEEQIHNPIADDAADEDEHGWLQSHSLSSLGF